jgi:tRNA A37 threonylcarbamoyladenosine synthetase subunit TsaC/SUA5/YrdC
LFNITGEGMNSIHDDEVCNQAAVLLKRGFPIGAYIRGVCGLWADGHQEKGLDALYRIKGERRGSRPVGTTLTSEAFIEMLDPDRISPSVRGLFLDERELVSRLGSLCFIRAPMKKEVADSIPDRVFSKTDDGTYWIQNWLPEGYTSAASWMDSICKAGISLPVATSMNVSGEPEIVDQEQGRQFCEANGVPMFLADPENPERAQGSFPILQVDCDGIRLIREGQFPPVLFRLLLSGWDIDLSNYRRAKFPLIDFQEAEGEQALESAELRRRLLEVMDG